MTASQPAIKDACQRAREALLAEAPRPTKDGRAAGALFTAPVMEARQEQAAKTSKGPEAA